MANIHRFIKRASEAYYSGQPIISNEEYDALENILGQRISGLGDINHAYRMYSLKKHYDKDGELPLNKKECVETIKLDGAAVDLLYIDGKFAQALTRGDGIKGRDISTKLMTMNIPDEIQVHGIVQVTGEVVASKNVENSRNYASGALNLKDMDAWEQRKTDGDMRFIAYNVQIVQNRWGINKTYTEDMLGLSEEGFETILGQYVEMPAEDGLAYKIYAWEDIYPTDGIVYRINDNDKFNSLGFTDKFPRGAIAWKEEQESVVTTLLDVEWQCGKSGKVTPVAILEPVMIGDASIARATLNNIAYIEALNLEIGCEVKVIRSGEIIPKIIGRV